MERAARRLTTPFAVVVTLLLAVVSVSGARVASASLLGTFDDVVLEGASFPVEPCTVDGTLYDSSFTPIPLDTSLSSLLTIGYVDLAAVDPDCVGAVPTVVVIGDDVLAGDFDTVLAEIPLAPLSSSPSELYDIRSLSLTLPLGGVVDEVRVALSPS